MLFMDTFSPLGNSENDKDVFFFSKVGLSRIYKKKKTLLDELLFNIQMQI